MKRMKLEGMTNEEDKWHNKKGYGETTKLQKKTNECNTKTKSD